MSAFLNVMFFFGVFGLILLFARLSENRAGRTVRRPEEKRAA
jgi:hypothetical protein